MLVNTKVTVCKESDLSKISYLAVICFWTRAPRELTHKPEKLIQINLSEPTKEVELSFPFCQ